jgi:N-acyl homoserine lactone hydrolase
MADDVPLYMFECGMLKCHVENIKMTRGLGEEYEIRSRRTWSRTPRATS